MRACLQHLGCAGLHIMHFCLCVQVAGNVEGNLQHLQERLTRTPLPHLPSLKNITHGLQGSLGAVQHSIQHGLLESVHLLQVRLMIY